MWKWILTPPRWRSELRTCYDKYPNDLHYIDTQLINVAYMKFANICVHSIKNYLQMSKWCVTYFAGYSLYKANNLEVVYVICSIAFKKIRGMGNLQKELVREKGCDARMTPNWYKPKTL